MSTAVAHAIAKNKKFSIHQSWPRERHKTWTYVSSISGLKKVRRILQRYLQQQYVYSDGSVEEVRIAIDVETYRKTPSTIGGTIPRAIWNGTDWESHIRLLQIGLDVDPSLRIRDKQFLIDVMRLGYDTVAAVLGDILSSSIWITQNGKYERQNFKAHLPGIIARHVIDTMLVSQVKEAGNRVGHGLGEQYERLLRGKGKFFENFMGMKFHTFKDFKKAYQKTDWSQPLTYNHCRYAASDVRGIFPLYEEQTGRIRRYVDKYERDQPEGTGIEEVIGLELAVMPIFADMEQQGIPFDRKYYETEVIPIMREQTEKAKQNLLKYPELRMKYPGGEKHIVFTGPISEEVLEDTKKVKSLIKSIYSDITGLSVTTKDKAQRKTVRVKWIKGPKRGQIYNIIRHLFNAKRGYSYVEERLICLSPSGKAIKPALSEICGRELLSCAENYLMERYDPKDPSHQVIKDYLRYIQCSGYESRYGSNLLAKVTPIGTINPGWGQIGSETNEISSGRTSSKEPNLMNIAGRDRLYAFDGEEGIESSKFLRSAYISDVGCSVWVADYSQIEPRITANMTRDKNLLRLFRNDEDMHELTAKTVWKIRTRLHGGTPWESLSREERKKIRDTFGKLVNLGFSYGLGWRNFIVHCRNHTNGEWEPSADEAKAIHKAYYELYPGMKRWQDKAEDMICRRVKKARSLAPWKKKRHGGEIVPFGYIANSFGRARQFCLLAEHHRMDDEELSQDWNPTDDRFYYNEYYRRINKCRLSGYNHLVQSTAGECLKFALLYIHRSIKRRGWDERKNRILLVLHDELMVQFEDDHMEEGGRIIRECMLKAAQKFITVVPTKISLGHGKNWFAAGKGFSKTDMGANKYGVLDLNTFEKWKPGQKRITA